MAIQGNGQPAVIKSTNPCGFEIINYILAQLPMMGAALSIWILTFRVYRCRLEVQSLQR